MSSPEPSHEPVLRDAAAVATMAPSIFNTQPWRWQVSRASLQLWADRERQLLVADPHGRLLTVSCGVGLHHARLALAVGGHKVTVTRMPDPAEPDLLATIRLDGTCDTRPELMQLYRAIAVRRTDRRPFSNEPVVPEVRTLLVAAAEGEGAHLHLITRDQVAVLAMSAAQAGAVQLANPDYRRELINWTHRPPWSGDGVPTTTAVETSPRHVPVRDFAPFGGPVLTAGGFTDRGALYAVIFTDDDNPLAWLRAGEALSAVLLNATSAGLGSAPISDVTELTVTREQLGTLIPGSGSPQLAIRVGHVSSNELPATPRRSRTEVIYP